MKNLIYYGLMFLYFAISAGRKRIREHKPTIGLCRNPTRLYMVNERKKDRRLFFFLDILGDLRAEHLANPKNRGRGGLFNRNFGRGFMGRGFDSHRTNFNHSFRGRRGFGGRNFHGRGPGRGRSQPQEQYYQNHYPRDHSDVSTVGTNQSQVSSLQDWDSHTHNSYLNQYKSGYSYHY